MSIGNRIKERRKQLSMSAETLAKLMNVSPATIYRYENGFISNMGTDKLGEIAKHLDIEPKYLMGWEEMPETTNLPSSVKPISEIRSYRVPLIGSVAAGQPILAEEDYETYVDAPSKADYALRVEGDSMEPGFLDGDIIYIKQQNDVNDGQIAVVLMDDTAALKHVYHIPNGLTLTSDNPKYSPMVMTYDKYNVIRILGIVVGYTRMFK